MKFHWTATDARGNRHTGLSEAASEREMVAQLRSQGLLPQTLKRQRPKVALRAFSTRISHSELTLFTRQIATLIAAALPLDEALDVLSLHATDTSASVARWGRHWEQWWMRRPGTTPDDRPWRANAPGAGWRAAPPALGAWEQGSRKAVLNAMRDHTGRS